MKALIEFLLSLFGITSKAKKSDPAPKPNPAKEPVEVPEASEDVINNYVLEGQLAKEAAKVNPIIPLDFKTPRIEKEFVSKLPDKNQDLKTILHDLNEYTNKTFKKKLVITMIDRTQEEQDYLYRNSAKYKKKKFISPHQLWHAADIRSFIFTKAEITKIENYLNKKYNDKNYYRWTAKCHEVGNNGMHFHIQFVMKAGLKKKGETL